MKKKKEKKEKKKEKRIREKCPGDKMHTRALGTVEPKIFSTKPDLIEY
jgi:hypothetical protein